MQYCGLYNKQMITKRGGTLNEQDLAITAEPNAKFYLYEIILQHLQQRGEFLKLEENPSHPWSIPEQL